MDKAQAIHEFWSSFDLPAYDESSVPDNAVMPYITYNVVTDGLDSVLPLHGSLWYRTTSWEGISKKAEDIAQALGENGYLIKKIDDGYVWMQKGRPFAQRMTDEDEQVRRIYVNVTAEFLTAY
jgi:hypothetical protein